MVAEYLGPPALLQSLSPENSPPQYAPRTGITQKYYVPSHQGDAYKQDIEHYVSVSRMVAKAS
jgi:hypothetical protein